VHIEQIGPISFNAEKQSVLFYKGFTVATSYDAASSYSPFTEHCVSSPREAAPLSVATRHKCGWGPAGASILDPNWRCYFSPIYCCTVRRSPDVNELNELNENIQPGFSNILLREPQVEAHYYCIFARVI
jgi:hypothetical protein